MTRPTCKTCRYWYHDDDVMADTDSHLRECRRQPPTYYADVNRLAADDNDLFGHWPLTFDDNWCGEHKPIETESKEEWFDAETERPFGEEHKTLRLDETSEARKVMADAIGQGIL